MCGVSVFGIMTVTVSKKNKPQTDINAGGLTCRYDGTAPSATEVFNSAIKDS